ncbi:BamA/TamA family outer membrane protein [uncultured Xylophilus sp.]|uniref:autotransporter assembly complex protein TamA n=1 Tax=uncultured Xylophilus sp. TaxID=296832 RepID=UPI0025DC2224|nr:BamA/TamA family outer membrane protein [uncultured Xylophilus sp.]
MRSSRHAVPSSLPTPARLPAFLFVAALSLQGCSVFKKSDDADAPADGSRILSSAEAGQDPEKTQGADRRDAFVLTVQAPPEIRTYLTRHLELQRYRTLDDLDARELSRLLGAAEANARELLGTLGYFAPRISLELNETPASGKAPREVLLAVDPGEQTRITDVDIAFAGEIENDARAATQRSEVTSNWSLRPGLGFTQDAWDGAKAGGLRRITAFRFPTASVKASRAEVDADTQRAKLSVTYDSGPAFRFGPVQVRGAERYPPEVAQRLSRLPVGADYDQAKLLEAQQRLASSGYFDSVFLTLDPDAPNPLAAPVIAQVRDANFQKVVFGIGFSTDSGPRVSLDHTHNRLPLIGWRAVSKLSFDRKTKVLNSEQTSLPDENQWRWVTAQRLQRETTGSYEVNSGRLRGGRAKGTDHIDRSYYLQYDYAKSQGPDAPPNASALSVNYSWTGRYFDNNTAPTRGYGLALEAGPGYTLTNERAPFVRTYARGLYFVPLGTVQPTGGGEARRSRLQLRAEAGAVATRATADVPAPLLFLTGGDTTVRGYSYRQIGARTVNGQLYAGRYLGVASAEWQRPIVWNGEMTEFESAVFLDAGAVADRIGDLQAKVGVGAGVRWRSPVGPLQADVAYGVDAKQLRLHLRLGFTF